MSRVIAQQWISIDGFASGVDDEQPIFAAVTGEVDERSQRHNRDLVPAVGSVLLGRRTYEQFVTYWPGATETIATHVNSVRKVVASTTLSEAPWGDHAPATVVPDAVDHVRHTRAQGDGDVLVWGSLALTHALLDAGEVDELDLFVAPVALGSGTPLLRRAIGLEQVMSEDWAAATHLRYRLR